MTTFRGGKKHKKFKGSLFFTGAAMLKSQSTRPYNILKFVGNFEQTENLSLLI